VAPNFLIFQESIDHSVTRVRLNLGISHSLGAAIFGARNPRVEPASGVVVCEEELESGVARRSYLRVCDMTIEY